MRTYQILAAIAAATCLCSCDSGRASAGTSGGKPSVIRYAYCSSIEDPDISAQRVEPVKQYLEKTLGVRVEVMRTTGYGSVIEAFRARKIDVASISPFSYVLATQKVPIEAIVMHGGQDGGAAVYTGSLAVPGHSPIHTVQDLIHHSKELTISFVDPDSASGFLVENAYLQSLGIEPQRDFRKMMFTTNHLASIMTLKAGKVDVAAVQERLVKRYVEQGKLAPGDVRIIWTSPTIPNQPIAVSKALPRPFIEEIRRAFLDMYQKDPNAFAAQTPRNYAGAFSTRTPYVPAYDSMFDGLRQMARNVPNLSLLEH